MLVSKKIAALAAGFISALSLATLAQNGESTQRSGETLVIDDATIDWIQKSDVAALREGVVKSLELEKGTAVKAGGLIGKLHAEIAYLTVRKAEVTVANKATEQKAAAQRQLAIETVATNKRLNIRTPGLVSQEEQRKAEAEVKVADAMVNEAVEKRDIDKADLELAKQALKEHDIVAPFDGVILERFKYLGESVRAGDSVVRMGNLDRLRVYAYVPFEYAYRIKEGQIVELQLNLNGTRVPLQVAQKRFRGKIMFIDPQIQSVGEKTVQVNAEFENADHDLRPGMSARMTFFLDSDVPPPNSVGARNTPEPPR
jgi:RND family efflux transporter MFP subunit